MRIIAGHEDGVVNGMPSYLLGLLLGGRGEEAGHSAFYARSRGIDAGRADLFWKGNLLFWIMGTDCCTKRYSLVVVDAMTFRRFDGGGETVDMIVRRALLNGLWVINCSDNLE